MEPGLFYHIYSHANGFEDIFREEKNYIYFLKRYSYYTTSVVDTYAYCLMPNHFHLLVRVKEENELISFCNLKDPTGFENLSGLVTHQFSKLLTSYAKAFNKMYERKGALFTRPFQRKEIDSDAYLTKVIHYVHTNPVHHGFVKEVDEWKWSSYLSLLSNKPTLLKREEVIKWFGGLEQFVKFHQQPINPKIAEYLGE